MKFPFRYLQRKWLTLTIFAIIVYRARSKSNSLNLKTAKNVLLIVVDDLRINLGIYKDKLAITPNLDQLGGKSTVFQRAYAQLAICAPSRSSFLTSRRPDSTRVYDFTTYWRESAGQFTTIPEYFRSHGYHTTWLGKIFHYGSTLTKIDRDVDMAHSWSAEMTWDQKAYPSFGAMARAPCMGDNSTFRHQLLCPVREKDMPKGFLADMSLASRASAFLQAWYGKPADDREPLFLAVGFYKPHIPFQFPSKYLDLFPLSTIEPVKNQDIPADMPAFAVTACNDVRQVKELPHCKQFFELIGETVKPRREGSIKVDLVSKTLEEAMDPPLELNTQKLIRQMYYAATTYVDDQIGRLLQGLSDSGMDRDTVVMLVSDHGFALGEHNQYGKYTNFEEAVQVPFMIHTREANGPLDFQHVDPFCSVKNESWDQKGAMREIEEPVELVDIMPTLAELSGLPAVPQCPDARSGYREVTCTEGRSLAALHTGTTQPDRKDHNPSNSAFSQFPKVEIVSQLGGNFPLIQSKVNVYMGYSARSVRFRYTEWVAFDWMEKKPVFANVSAVELYDHEIDPGEMENVHGRPSYAGIERQFAKVLRERLSR